MQMCLNRLEQARLRHTDYKISMDEEAYDLGGRSNKKRNILECTTTFLFTPPKCDMSKRFKLRFTNFIAAQTIEYSKINNQLFREHRVECLAHRAHHYDQGTSPTQSF